MVVRLIVLPDKRIHYWALNSLCHHRVLAQELGGAPTAVQSNALAIDVTAFIRGQKKYRIGNIFHRAVAITWGHFLIDALNDCSMNRMHWRVFANKGAWRHGRILFDHLKDIASCRAK